MRARLAPAELCAVVAATLLLGAVAVPFYGWYGLRTVGPSVGLVGLGAIAIARVRTWRWLSLAGAAIGIASCALTVARLITRARVPAALAPYLGHPRSLTALWLGAAGGALVAVAGILPCSTVRVSRCSELWTGTGASAPAARRRRAARPEVRAALASAWGALWRSRSLVWAAGIIAVLKAGESTLGIGPHLAHPFGSFGSVLSAPASQWDSGRYLAIAQVGYAIDPSDKAFFPLYPILIRFGAWSQQAALITGVVISIGALAASLYLLYRLVELESDAETARLAVAVVAFFPMSLFFSAVYSDSLFLALSLASFYSARRGWWARAGVAGGLAAATRFVGVLLLAPVALMYVGAIRGRFDRRALFMLLIPAGASAYFVYQAAHGSFLAPLHAEHLYWQRRNVPLLGAVHGVRDFVRSVLQIFGGPGSHHLPTAAGGQLSNPAALAVANITDFAFLVFGCITTVLAARRLAPAYAVYAGASVLVLVSTFPPVEPLASLPRYVAVVFPCEISLALWARGHPRRRATVLLISAGLMALFAGEFATANWVA